MSKAEQMYQCPKWKECENCPDIQLHKHNNWCDYKHCGCPACVPVSSASPEPYNPNKNYIEALPNDKMTKVSAPASSDKDSIGCAHEEECYNSEGDDLDCSDCPENPNKPSPASKEPSDIDVLTYHDGTAERIMAGEPAAKDTGHPYDMTDLDDSEPAENISKWEQENGRSIPAPKDVLPATTENPRLLSDEEIAIIVTLPIGHIQKEHPIDIMSSDLKHLIEAQAALTYPIAFEAGKKVTADMMLTEAESSHAYMRLFADGEIRHKDCIVCAAVATKIKKQSEVER